MNELKLTKEFINNSIIKRGYIPLDFEVYGYKQNIKFMDSYGYKYEVNWTNFNHSQNFKQITYTNPYSVENAKLYLKLNNIPIKLISKEINNVTELLDFEMECGHSESISWNKMKRRRSYQCVDCYIKYTRSKDKLLSKDSIISRFKESGLFIEDINKYKRVTTKLDCHDKYGYRYCTRYVDIKSNKSPDKFSKHNPYTIHNIKLYINIEDIDIEYLDGDYVNENSKLLWKCKKCGFNYFASWSKIRDSYRDKNKNLYCEKCTTKSSLEEKVLIYLNKIGIEYNREYRFKDCINIRALPFDFYIQRYNLCIECDGIGHFEPTRFNGIDLERAEYLLDNTRRRDNIKTLYCNKNGINLLRIPYWEFYDNTYKNKINQYLN